MAILERGSVNPELTTGKEDNEHVCFSHTHSHYMQIVKKREQTLKDH